MMQLIKLKLNEEHYNQLKAKADEWGVSVQEYVKISLLDGYILNPIEAVRRAMEPEFQEKYKGREFELPDLYSESEWPSGDRGVAGAFGKTFFNYVYKKKPGNLRYVKDGRDGKRAIYTLI